MKYHILIEPDEGGVFVATVPTMPGCVSQGRTREEALANVKEAIAAYLESVEAHDESVRAARIEEAAKSVFERRRSVFKELAKGPK